MAAELVSSAAETHPSDIRIVIALHGRDRYAKELLKSVEGAFRAKDQLIASHSREVVGISLSLPSHTDSVEVWLVRGAVFSDTACQESAVSAPSVIGSANLLWSGKGSASHQKRMRFECLSRILKRYGRCHVCAQLTPPDALGHLDLASDCDATARAHRARSWSVTWPCLLASERGDGDPSRSPWRRRPSVLRMAALVRRERAHTVAHTTARRSADTVPKVVVDDWGSVSDGLVHLIERALYRTFPRSARRAIFSESSTSTSKKLPPVPQTLFHAAAANDPSTVRTIVERAHRKGGREEVERSVQLRDGDGLRALDVAVLYDSDEAARALLAAFPQRLSRRLLSVAFFYRSAKLVEALLRGGVYIEKDDWVDLAGQVPSAIAAGQNPSIAEINSIMDSMLARRRKLGQSEGDGMDNDTASRVKQASHLQPPGAVRENPLKWGAQSCPLTGSASTSGILRGAGSVPGCSRGNLGSISEVEPAVSFSPATRSSAMHVRTRRASTSTALPLSSSHSDVQEQHGRTRRASESASSARWRIGRLAPFLRPPRRSAVRPASPTQICSTRQPEKCSDTVLIGSEGVCELDTSFEVVLHADSDLSSYIHSPDIPRARSLSFVGDDSSSAAGTSVENLIESSELVVHDDEAESGSAGSEFDEGSTRGCSPSLTRAAAATADSGRASPAEGAGRSPARGSVSGSPEESFIPHSASSSPSDRAARGDGVSSACSVFELVAAGYATPVASLIRDFPDAYCNERDENGNSLIEVAALYGHADICSMLLRARAAASEALGGALRLALANRHADVVRVLTEGGCVGPSTPEARALFDKFTCEKQNVDSPLTQMLGMSDA